MINQELRNASRTRRIAPYVEAIVFAAVVLGINFLVFRSDPGYYSWSFNPYLFVVLVIAGRYGLVPGLFTAFVCLGCYLGTLIWMLTGTPITLIITPPHYGLIVTFCLGGFIVGNLADRARERLDEALRQHDEVRLRHDRLSSQFTLLSDEKHLLDKQVLSEEETFPALVGLFEDLDLLDPAEIPPRIVRLAPRLLGGGRAALYKFDHEARAESTAPADAGAPPGHAPPPARTGQGRAAGRLVADDGGWAPAVEREHPVVARALGEEGMATIAQLRGITDLGTLARDPIQLGCRLPQAENAPLLVLLMKELPFAAFAPSRLAALHSGMDVAGRALERAIVFKLTQDRNVDDPVTKACTTVYFYKRLEEDYALALRHKMPLSVLTVQVPGLEKRVKKEQHARLRQVLAQAFQESLRNGDLLAHHQSPGSFMVLCPFTPEKGAQVVARRLREKVAAMIRKPDVSTDHAVHVLVIAVDPKTTPLDELKRSINSSLVGERDGGGRA